jgi:hypothetical protein
MVQIKINANILTGLITWKKFYFLIINGYLAVYENYTITVRVTILKGNKGAL